MQPFVDAAFKNRGLDPENFWRSAGLPAYRWPDPNGTRFPNGAPPPPPQVLEGTPDHPGPAVPPGSPCSYTPANPGGNVTVGDDGLPRPWNPLPCAGAAIGPFGGFGFPAPIDVQISPPNPNGLPPTPGIPIAGPPGEPAPERSGHTGAAARRATGRADHAGATGTVLAAAGVPAGSARSTWAGTAAAGPVHQSGRIRG